MLTTVLPFVMFCVSLWAWAQKSTHAVTPENGRPSVVPKRQSCPNFSCPTWKDTSQLNFCVSQQGFQQKFSEVFNRMWRNGLIFALIFNQQLQSSIFPFCSEMLNKILVFSLSTFFYELRIQCKYLTAIMLIPGFDKPQVQVSYTQEPHLLPDFVDCFQASPPVEKRNWYKDFIL